MSIKFHHIALTVSDVDKSAEWYGDKLGFIVADKYDEGGMSIRILRLGEIKLELISFGKDTKTLPEYRSKLIDDLHVIGTKHLCLDVENLSEFIGKLKSKGVEFASEIDTTFFGGNYIFFKDLDGILIEAYGE